MRLDQIYSEQLDSHPEGHALYKKLSTLEIKPGSCGFFDHDGDWNPILQLSDENELKAGGWTLLNGVRIIQDAGIRWRAKTSKGTTGIRAGISVTSPALPVGAGGTVSFKTSSSAGAVLIADGPIQHHQAQPSSKFLDWMVQNSSKLISSHRDAQTYGIWIITKTYSAKRCALTVLTSKNAEATISLDVKASDVGITPSASWWNQSSSEAWSIHSDKNGVVMFMSGIYFRPRRFKTTELKAVLERKKQKIWLGNRGELETIVVEEKTPNGDEYYMELLPELVGEVEKGGEEKDYEEQAPPGFHDFEDEDE